MIKIRADILKFVKDEIQSFGTKENPLLVELDESNPINVEAYNLLNQDLGLKDICILKLVKANVRTNLAKQMRVLGEELQKSER